MRRMPTAAVLALIVAAAAVAFAAPSARAEDRHAGYYYPKPVTVEVYKPRARQFADFDREKRIGFVTAIAAMMMERPYPPQHALFAKGKDAEKLILLPLVDGRMTTLPMARALLAVMSGQARTTPFFRDNAVADTLTFFDLAWMMGFTQLTVSDGATYSHQIKFDPDVQVGADGFPVTPDGTGPSFDLGSLEDEAERPEDAQAIEEPVPTGSVR